MSGWRRAITLDQFQTLAEAELRWLTDDYGFVIADRRRIGRMYAGILLTNSTSHVRVGWEPQDGQYMPIDVGTIAAAAAIERHVERGRYPLWLVASIRGSSRAESLALENARGESSAEVQSALGAASDVLRRCAMDILSGDFSSFVALEEAFNSYVSENAMRFGLPPR